jgi:hypothetical protein
VYGVSTDWDLPCPKAAEIATQVAAWAIVTFDQTLPTSLFKLSFWFAMWHAGFNYVFVLVL